MNKAVPGDSFNTEEIKTHAVNHSSFFGVNMMKEDSCGDLITDVQSS